MKVKDIRAQLDGLDDELEIYEFDKFNSDYSIKTGKNIVFGFVATLINRQTHFSFDKTEIYKHKVLILI